MENQKETIPTTGERVEELRKMLKEFGVGPLEITQVSLLVYIIVMEQTQRLLK